MKYLIVLIIIGTVSFGYYGCYEGSELSQQTIFSGYDFTKYTNNGFLFTPEKYNEKYAAIGIVKLTILPAVKKAEKNKSINNSSTNYDTWNRDKSISVDWTVERVTAQDVLDSLYNYSKNMGANAITELKIVPSEEFSNGKIFFRGITASGFAIKRQ